MSLNPKKSDKIIKSKLLREPKVKVTLTADNGVIKTTDETFYHGTSSSNLRRALENGEVHGYWADGSQDNIRYGNSIASGYALDKDPINPVILEAKIDRSVLVKDNTGFVRPDNSPINAKRLIAYWTFNDYNEEWVRHELKRKRLR